MIQAHSFEELNLADTWLTIGVFDGVHRGHQQIIRKLVADAHAASSLAVVMTFWPHPATVLGNREFRCLTTPDERLDLLAALGVDVAIVQPFNESLAGTPAADFVRALKKHLGFEHLLIGYDFALGKGREGDAARLQAMGKDLGYMVDVVPALGDESGVISSTEIRKLVSTGNVSDAGALLGHCYSVRGRVVHGDSRGRELGFPTANIQYPAGKIMPANGVYACYAWVRDQRYSAATNVGVRPQFHDKASVPLVEAFLLDFDRDIYEQDIRLEFVARLRDELKFSSVDALIEQMHRDVQLARQILST